MSKRETLLCQMVFKLSRRHGWGSPISEDGLIDLALPSSDQGRGRELLDILVQEPYIKRTHSGGYQLKNDPYSQAQAAYRLVNTCEYDEFQVEATLSRFEQKGGFDYYEDERNDILQSLGAW